jgi:carbonic anhydrase
VTTGEQLEAVLEANRAFVDTFDGGTLGSPPARRLLVLTCIDARLDPARFLGLEIGDAHVLRNAGGRVTDDVVRSAVISSWLKGTREFLVINHTDCGMTAFTNGVLRGIVGDATGVDVSHEDYLPFSDVEQAVREDVARLRAVKALPEDVWVTGLIYDVRTGVLSQVG